MDGSIFLAITTPTPKVEIAVNITQGLKEVFYGC
jgi:hypothetical protein